MERPAGHRDRDVDAARADGDLSDAAARRRVRVGSEQRRPRLAEAFEVELMADAVARLRIDDAVLLGDRREEVMVIGVLKADLHGVVVDIADGEIVLDVLDAHRLELQIGHRARRVLRQRLVDADSDLRIRRRIPLDEVLGENLLYDVHLLHDFKLPLFTFTFDLHLTSRHHPADASV